MRRSSLFIALLACGCSSKTDGPTPAIASIMPAPICDAQKAITLTLTGSGFSPVVVGGLTGSPAVRMPKVSLVSSSGTEAEVPADGVSIPDASGSTLAAVVPQGLVPPGTYDLVVENPDGHAATSPDFVVHAPPDLVSIAPTHGAPGQMATLTLTGTSFQPAMTVTLGSTPPVACTNVMVSADGTSATCTLDLTGVKPGAYAITVDNGDGCADTLPMAFTVGDEFTLTGIDPPFGCTCSTTSVTIGSASGFASTPRVELRPHGQATPVTLMTRVAFVDASTLTAVVPAGLPLGNYDVTVIDPPSAAGIGRLDNAFRVVSKPVPAIEEIVPSRGSPTADTPVAISGTNFRDPVKIELLDRTGTVVKTIASVTPTSATQIDATFPTSGLTEDAYLVRVTALDEMTFSTFSAFIVGKTGSSGNLHPFGASSNLVTARRMLAGLSARDDLGNHFVYAIGGDSGGATSTVLDTVEVSQLSKFGALGAWRSIRAPNHLTTARAAPAAVAVPLFGADPFIPVKTYIYVTGGRDAGGAVLGSLERAVVLRNADAPVVSTIAASETAGTLAAGTWYYKVAAVLDATDPDNPGGETLPSDEAIITLATAGAIDLAWGATMVNGKPAASYRVYRTAAVDGTSQQELLIGTTSGTTFTDTGATAGTEAPLPPGSLGVWRAQTATHGIRWGHQAAVIASGTSRFLYVLGGKSDAMTGLLSTVEVAPIDTAGAVGAFSSTGTSAMTTARAFFSLVVETPQNVSGFTGVARLFTLGGVDGGGASQAVEQSDATSTGGNGAWSAYSGAGTLGARAGLMGVIASDKLFALGGAQSATSTTFSGIRANGSDIPFDANGNMVGPINSTAQAFPAGSPRALGAAIIGAGFIYFVGGSSTGADAVATTFQTF